MSINYGFEYDIREYIDVMMCDMLKHDDAVPDIRRWDEGSARRFANLFHQMVQRRTWQQRLDKD